MNDSPGYALGYTDVEHDRLARQARRMHASTDGFFRASGVRAGMRVLDLGSGIGDVALVAARIVGPGGEVVGIERDSRSVDVARARTIEAGAANVSFICADLAAVEGTAPFDAIVGRFILQFLPDPLAVLRSVSRMLAPGGIVAIQEVAWPPSLAANAHLPLWSLCASIVYDTIRRKGANPDIGLALHQIFADAGLPAPALTVELRLTAERSLMLWAYDLFVSIRASAQSDERIAALGPLETLADRIEAEAQTKRTAVASITVIGATTRVG